MPHDLGIHRYVLSVCCVLRYDRMLGKVSTSSKDLRIDSVSPNQGGTGLLKPMMALRQRTSWKDDSQCSSFLKFGRSGQKICSQWGFGN